MEYKAFSHHDVVRRHRSFFGFLRIVFVQTRVAPVVSRIHLSPAYPCLALFLVPGPLPLAAVGTLSLLPEFSTPPLVFVEIRVPPLAFAEIRAPEIRNKLIMKFADFLNADGTNDRPINPVDPNYRPINPLQYKVQGKV